MYVEKVINKLMDYPKLVCCWTQVSCRFGRGREEEGHVSSTSIFLLELFLGHEDGFNI
jgi:hypothetical protein